MLTSPAALADLAADIRQRGVVAVDTEFVSGSTYYPRLGLVQLGLSDTETFLVDAPAVEDWTPLVEVIEDPGIVKILHDAQQDLLILRRAMGAYPKNVFDTQQAAGFLGFRASMPLNGLLKAMLDVRISKDETRSDWMKRPLSDRQMAYARDDVRYLPELRQVLIGKAEQRGRLAWINEERAAYDIASTYDDAEPSDAFWQVKGMGRMRGRQLARLEALATWREEEARRRDRPRTHIAHDDVLTKIVNSNVTEEAALRKLRYLSENLRRRYARPLARILADVDALPESEWPRQPPRRSHSEADQLRGDLALTFIRGRALIEGVDPSLVATRAGIKTFVQALQRKRPEHPLLAGWRREFIGDDLLRLMRGQAALVVDPGSGLPVLQA
ncbi:MAG: HRDC domain-containing protein [Bacteroidota bacterium]